MGRIVSLSLQIRRFRCSQSGCPRRIFAERLSAAVPFRKRRTVQLAEVQRSLALGAGGELGSRLVTRLAMLVSGDTLLLLIRAVPVEPPPPARVIGINDWAWRHSKRDATIHHVPEAREPPIDLSPTGRLKAQLDIEIVARERTDRFTKIAGGVAWLVGN